MKNDAEIDSKWFNDFSDEEEFETASSAETRPGLLPESGSVTEASLRKSSMQILKRVGPTSDKPFEARGTSTAIEPIVDSEDSVLSKRLMPPNDMMTSRQVIASLLIGAIAERRAEKFGSKSKNVD